MPKFSRFDPRNKKNGRHKKLKTPEYADKKATLNTEDDKYIRKYKKIEYMEDIDE